MVAHEVDPRPWHQVRMVALPGWMIVSECRKRSIHSVLGRTGTMTTPEIVAQTTRAELSLPVGMCFWLRCSLSGCSVRTSIKVGITNPRLW